MNQSYCAMKDDVNEYWFNIWNKSLERIMPSVTTTVTQEVELEPVMRRQLLIELRAFAAIKEQLVRLQHQSDAHKAAIGALRDETGAQTLSVEGFTISLVAPIRKVFNKKKFVLVGGDLALYEQAMDNVSSRAYDRISCPGSDDE